MGRRKLGSDVFDNAVARMCALYEAGHRVVVSFSGGKDSTCCLEVCLVAARMTGRLPVEVIMRDEEIMFPGTFEYCERVVARREEVDFHWIYACQPVTNVFNRSDPYFWVFDPLLVPEQWVRQPPEYAYRIPDLNIQRMTIPSRFPPVEGKELYAVLGLRVQESRGRLLGLHSSRGYVTQPNRYRVRLARPIYDWQDGDVWKAIGDYNWDYDDAYDVMARFGVPVAKMRIAPPTLNYYGAELLQMAARAWPGWFDRVCERLPGVRLAAKYGKRAVEPVRRVGETWEQCFWRTCVDEAPRSWIAERARCAAETVLRQHAIHSAGPLPEVVPCRRCSRGMASWRKMAMVMYGGDPMSLKAQFLPYLEPEFFRPGTGTWDGPPTFK